MSNIKNINSNNYNNNFGHWGLGIGRRAQSPIPNPQSPLINYKTY